MECFWKSRRVCERGVPAAVMIRLHFGEVAFAFFPMTPLSRLSTQSARAVR
jgi:hypothetical protein